MSEKICAICGFQVREMVHDESLCRRRKAGIDDFYGRCSDKVSFSLLPGTFEGSIDWREVTVREVLEDGTLGPELIVDSDGSGWAE